MGLTGPNARASGVNWDLRAHEPYGAYREIPVQPIVFAVGDVYDRYLIRLHEIRQSVDIIEQALDGLPLGPWIADDRKVVLPPRHELHTSMESLIHHFKLVTEGYRVPAGEAYACVEGPRGELGCHLVSDGSAKPWRVHFRSASLVMLQSVAALCKGVLLADLIAILASLDPNMGDCDR
jgi:NADH-quinone oxidoreductase subunit D